MVKGYLKELDAKIYNLLVIKEPFISLLKVITFLASTKYLVLVSLLLLIILRNKYALIIISLLLITSIVINSFKHLFKRGRPQIRQLVKEKGYSYPSGHTCCALAFYGIIFYLMLLWPISGGLKVILGLFLIVLVILIGFSRIYLGVHYFSDVIGGLIIESSCLLIYIYVISNVLKLV